MHTCPGAQAGGGLNGQLCGHSFMTSEAEVGTVYWVTPPCCPLQAAPLQGSHAAQEAPLLLGQALLVSEGQRV